MGDRLETGGKLKPAAEGIPRHGGIVEIRAHGGEQVESAAQRGDAIGIIGAHAGHAGLERRATFLHEGRGQLAQAARRTAGNDADVRAPAMAPLSRNTRHGGGEGRPFGGHVPGLVAIQPAVEGFLRVAGMAALRRAGAPDAGAWARWRCAARAASSRPGRRARFSSRSPISLRRVLAPLRAPHRGAN